MAKYTARTTYEKKKCAECQQTPSEHTIKMNDPHGFVLQSQN